MSQRVLVVIDMQNDFITGSLGTKEAQAIVEKVCRKIQGFDGEVLFTLDTHGPDYLETQEGRLLPVAHCLRGTEGWQLERRLADYAAGHGCPIFDKPAFGSLELADYLRRSHRERPIDEIVLIGVCTDICVISNALLLKAALPEVPIAVEAACCAGVTPQRHQNALEAMAACQIAIR